VWSVAGCMGTGAHRPVAENVLSMGLIGHDAEAGARSGPVYQRGVKPW
jgi:hypothetical protein